MWRVNRRPRNYSIPSKDMESRSMFVDAQGEFKNASKMNKKERRVCCCCCSCVLLEYHASTIYFLFQYKMPPLLESTKLNKWRSYATKLLVGPLSTVQISWQVDVLPQLNWIVHQCVLMLDQLIGLYGRYQFA